MGVSLTIDDYDNDFHTIDTDPVLLNSLYRDEVDSINPVKAVMVTEYDGDYVQTLPACACGSTKGRPNYGVVCPSCDTEVMSPIERGFVTDVWVEAPEGVRSFILPNFFAMLDAGFKKNKFNAFRYLCYNRYKVEEKAEGVLERMKASGIPRGYNFFIDNFEEVFTQLMLMPIFKDKRAHNEKVLAVYKKYGKTLFPRFLPMPSKRSVITELSGKGRKIAGGYQHLLNGASAIYEACNPRLSVADRERATFNALTMFRDYHAFVDGDILGSKEGWYRKHVFGSRMGPTFRAVISSLAGIHEYDELHLPFGVAIATFRPYIMNKLLRQGYLVNEAERFIINAITAKGDQSESPMMAIINEIIDECPHKGLPVLFGRQPTLNLRSIQLFYVTKVKSDPADNTIGISILAIKGPNADFDGDQMQGMPILSYVDWERAKMLAAHTGINSLKAPRSLNRNLIMPDTDFSCLNNFMYGKTR